MSEPKLDHESEARGDGHLSDVAIEALASGRLDLLSGQEREHQAGCAACQGRLDVARTEMAALSSALKFELPPGELDALVASAMASVPEMTAEAKAVNVAPPPRSLIIAAVLASMASVALWLLSVERVPSVGGVLGAAQRSWAVGAAMDRLVTTFVPGGWGGAAVALAVIAVALASPLARLMAVSSSTLARAGAAALLLLGVSVAPTAYALDFTGEWPEGERLTLVIDEVPTSVALERAAEAAGLGFVGALSVDPPTHLRVRNASLRDVVTAIVGSDAPLVVERTATLLIVRPAPATSSEPPVESEPANGGNVPVGSDVVPPTPPTPPLVPVPAVPPVPPVPGAIAQPVPPPPPVSEEARRAARDRVTMGGDVVVRPGEVVASVVTMGGDAEIGGEVLRDVVTMGGNVHLQRGSVVHGEIVAMGGEVQVDEGAIHTGDAVGDDGEWGEEEEEPETLESWLRDLFASAARHMLLFLFGLLLMGLTPSRLDLVSKVLVAQPARSAGIGVLAALAAIVLALLLVITIVGIPGALLLAVAAALAVYGGLVAVASVIGRVLPIAAIEGKPVLQLAAGVTALFVASLAPLIGVLVTIIAAFVGLGAVVATRAGTRLQAPPPTE